MSEIADSDFQKKFEEVAAQIIAANPDAYAQMMQDMRVTGAAYLKTNADGTVERIAPELIRGEV